MSDQSKSLSTSLAFCLDTHERVLFNDGKLLPLKPKV